MSFGASLHFFGTFLDPAAVLANKSSKEGAVAMVLEVLIGLLLVAGVGATLLSFFVVKSNRSKAEAEPLANHDVDNPQRDIKQD